MSLVTRSTTASPDLNSLQHAPQIPDLYAGEDIDLLAPCYIKSSDGKAYMCNATSADEAAEFAGFSARAAKSGQPVTLFGLGARFKYGTGLTPGDVFYLAATAGRLDTAATTGDSLGVAMVVTATDIIVTRASSLTLNAVADGAMTGTKVSTVANANVVGGIPVLHRIDIAAGALADTDVVLTHKTRVIDAWLVLRGAGVSTTTLQVKNGANAITDAMAASGSDQAVVRCASLNDAYWEIAAGGTLRVTSATGATQPAATVYVLGVRVA